MTFERYVEELTDAAQPLAVSKLVNLSGLAAEERSAFLNVWLGMDAERRRRIVSALFELGEENVELNFDGVFFIALADSDVEVRRSAIKGLWEHEGRDLIDPLVGMLRGDPDPGVRAESALALGRFVLKAEFDALPAAAAERVEEVLHSSIDDREEVTEVRARALESLGARSEPWVRELIERSYHDEERRFRLSAVHAMGRSCDAAWLSAILPELESEDDEMRFEAAVACGEIEDEGALPHLLALLEDEDAEVQEAAIRAFGQIGGAPAKEALEELLEDADERVREAVTEAMVEIEFEEDPLGLRTESEQDE